MKPNKDLTEIEFAISTDIKRAMVSLHDGDYSNAAHHLREALWYVERIISP